EIGEIGVEEVVLDAPFPSLDRAAARDPHRWAWILDWHRPRIDIAQLGELAVEGERLPLLPCPHNQLNAFAILVAQGRRVGAIAIDRVHRRADWEACNQPPTR